VGCIKSGGEYVEGDKADLLLDKWNKVLPKKFGNSLNRPRILIMSKMYTNPQCLPAIKPYIKYKHLRNKINLHIQLSKIER
jgi:hypothetical protein